MTTEDKQLVARFISKSIHIKSNSISLVQKTFSTTVLDLYKETQGELKLTKPKLPYGISFLGKIHFSILFLPEVD